MTKCELLFLGGWRAEIPYTYQLCVGPKQYAVYCSASVYTCSKHSLGIPCAGEEPCFASRFCLTGLGTAWGGRGIGSMVYVVVFPGGRFCV